MTEQNEKHQLQFAFRHLVNTSLEEYINEAEHQVGEEYWDHFDNAFEVLHDFILFLSFIYRMSAGDAKDPTLGGNDNDGDNSPIR